MPVAHIIRKLPPPICRVVKSTIPPDPLGEVCLQQRKETAKPIEVATFSTSVLPLVRPALSWGWDGF